VIGKRLKYGALKLFRREHSGQPSAQLYRFKIDLSTQGGTGELRSVGVTGHGSVHLTNPREPTRPPSGFEHRARDIARRCGSCCCSRNGERPRNRFCRNLWPTKTPSVRGVSLPNDASVLGLTNLRKAPEGVHALKRHLVQRQRGARGCETHELHIVGVYTALGRLRAEPIDHVPKRLGPVAVIERQ
jgi:hypothetical protein